MVVPVGGSGSGSGSGSGRAAGSSVSVSPSPLHGGPMPPYLSTNRDNEVDIDIDIDIDGERDAAAVDDESEHSLLASNGDPRVVLIPPSPSILKGVSPSSLLSSKWRRKDHRDSLCFGWFGYGRYLPSTGTVISAGVVSLLVIALLVRPHSLSPSAKGRGGGLASSTDSTNNNNNNNKPPSWKLPLPDTSVLPGTHWRLPFKDTPTKSPNGILVGDTVETSHGAVSSESAICSEIGASMLKQGGNAVDAGVAVAACLGVTGSFFSGAGGGGFLTFRTPDGKSGTVNFREAAPSAATRDMFKGHEKDAQLGGKAAGVPGEFAGLHLAHKLHGRLPWQSVILPSANLSITGFPVTRQLSLFLSYFGDAILSSDLAQIFAPQGKILQPGETVYRVPYGNLLTRIALEGPAAFYNSDLTKLMVDYLNKGGGIHKVVDWNTYKAELQESMSMTFRGIYRIYSAPPPASGAVLLSILSILDQLAPFSDQPDNKTLAKEQQRMVESFKWSYAWRGALGDPGLAPGYEFNPKIGELLKEATDKARARKISRKISDTETHDAKFYEPKFDPKEMPGTTHFSVIDKEGWAVAMTSTVNLLWGNWMVEPTTGVIFNNEMDDFSWPGYVNNGSQSGLPASPANYVAANKRPLSASAPAIVELLDPRGRPIDVLLAIGGAGGSRITTAVAQVLLDIIDRGMSVTQAMFQPRLHHQLYPNTLYLEPHVQEDLKNKLEEIGHEVSLLPPTQHLAVVSAVAKRKGVIEGCGDPRNLDGGAAGWDGK